MDLWFLPLYYYLCYTILCPCKLKDHQTEKENPVWQRAHTRTHPATVNVFDLSYTVEEKKALHLLIAGFVLPKDFKMCFFLGWWMELATDLHYRDENTVSFQFFADNREVVVWKSHIAYAIFVKCIRVWSLCFFTQNSALSPKLHMCTHTGYMFM